MSPHCHTLIQSLRAQGHRLTPQREAVIEIVAHSGGHMTAEEVFAQAQHRTRAITRATVYRTLDMLVAAGLVTRLLLAGVHAYATAQHGPHFHLVCRQCGQTQEIAADPRLLATLADPIREQLHFTVEFQHLSLPGLCATCQAEQAAAPGTAQGEPHAHS